MRTLMIAGAASTLLALPIAAFAQEVAAPVGAPVEAAKPAETATASAQKTAEQATADRENEWICKREKEIGSLVKTRKTCHTRKQWAYIDQENQRLGQDMILSNQGKPSGN